MPIQIIRGEANSGKSSAFMDMIASMPEYTHIILVPDQYSFSTESKLVARFGGTGINGIEALTIRQMIRRYLPRTSRYLAPSGKRMLLYKAAKASLAGTVYDGCVSKPGFLDSINSLICEMKRYTVSSDDIKNVPADKALRNKTDAISAVYSCYEDLINDGFLDSEDDILRVAEYIESSDEFKNTHIWIDEFSDFLPCHYRVIEAFIKKSAGVHLCLCIDSMDWDSPYTVPAGTYKKFLELGNIYGISETIIENTMVKPPELDHLQKNWISGNIYVNKANHIHIFKARDIYSEAEHAASVILDLVREDKLRFRDICVIVPSNGTYEDVIEPVFDSYKIPYFSDRKISVSDHPIARLVTSFFDVINESWSYDSVFSYIRTGFIYKKYGGTVKRLSDKELDSLENYVLMRGIRGKKKWFSQEDWTEESGGIFDEDEEKKTAFCDNVRREVVRPFASFIEKQRSTIRETAKAFFEFLDDIHLYEGIEKDALALEKAGRMNEAEQFRKVWNLIVEVIDQIVTVMGDDKCSLEDFGAYLSAGLSQCEIGIIPTGADRVSVANEGRNAAGGCRAVIIVGSVFGEIPKSPTAEGILTDRERKLLNEGGVTLAPDTMSQLADAQYKIFRILASPREELFVSFPVSDAEGRALEPAKFVRDLISMFPESQISDNLVDDGKLTLSSPEATLPKVLIHRSSTPLWKAVYEWYKSHEEFAPRLSVTDRARELGLRRPSLSAECASELYYTRTRHSVSRMEEFSKCPFRYFAANGLRAKERQIRQFKPVDLGNLVHSLIQKYCQTVEEGADSHEEKLARWRNLSDEESDSIIENLSENAWEKASDTAKRTKNLISRTAAALKSAVSIIRLSLSLGEYSSLGHEVEFETEIEGVLVYGKIDRIDISPNGPDVSLRIIDYKSGNKKYDPLSVYNGLDLQLVLYACAAAGLCENDARVTGIFYDHVIPPKVSGKSIEEIEKERSKAMLLEGRIFDDGQEDVFRMDMSIPEKKKSRYLKVSLKKDGDFDSKSAVDPSRNFELLEKHVKRTVAKINSRIRSGVIDVTPYKHGNLTGCDYCPYIEICLFDREHGRFRIGEKDKNAIWDKINEEQE